MKYISSFSGGKVAAFSQSSLSINRLKEPSIISYCSIP